MARSTTRRTSDAEADHLRVLQLVRAAVALDRHGALAMSRLSSTTTIALSSIRLDGGTQSRAALDEDAVADYAMCLADLPRMVVFYDGESYWMADGFHRAHAFGSAGRKKVEVVVKQGTARDALLYSVGANRTHGLRRTQADKRRAVELLLADEEWRARSDRWIAKACGVSDHLVADLRATASSRSSPHRTGQDGKVRPASNGHVHAASPEPELPDVEPEASFAADNAALFSSERDSWCTPPAIIKAVREVLHVVELDPCSNADSDVHARTEWCEKEDGLSRDWTEHGTVYANPPYGDGIGPWVDKCIASGRETDVIALIPARTDTTWFHRIIESCAAIGFLRGRLTFKGAPHPAPFPSAIVYWGERQEFRTVFEPLCTRLWLP